MLQKSLSLTVVTSLAVTPILFGPLAQAATVNSFPASTFDYPNPERGFYRASWSNNLHDLTQADANDAFNNGYRLLFVRIKLDDYKSTNTLPTAYLNSLRTAFGYARAAGIKLIVRGVYNYPANETEYQNAQDAPLSRIQAHLSQLKPVFQENADVIAFVQGGFIGAWGEWHTSSNGLDTDSGRTAVKNALLDAVPASRFVQFRYPRHIKPWASTLPSVSAAVSGNFRLGFHNDCFLASERDVGTYDDNPGASPGTTPQAYRDYADALGNIGPVGGETCDSTWDSSAVRRTACSDILGEGAKYNFTYLNSQYWRPQFHVNWENNGCMPDVRNKLGYRLALVKAAHANAVARGSAFNVTFTISNSGWARVYNPRAVQVILQHTGTNTAYRINATGADPRLWVPGSSNASVNATVPSNMPAGTYRVLLALPDPASTLINNKNYAIRFANDNNSPINQYWDWDLGAYAFGTTVQITS